MRHISSQHFPKIPSRLGFSTVIIQAYNAMRESFPVREETEKLTEPYVAYGEGASEVSTMKWDGLSIAPNMALHN